jgi:TolB-like protein
MAGLIPGYEYDIFISYRQKDNKHDGWVTEFVNNLKGELEATFKEDVSVYFDINPLDGLMETHDVSESLKDKLKCLVFIPIISRTYCDPKSFAWEHEFKAFIELASGDPFGLRVKMPNGNVASRILPVRIHDLDAEDVNLYEKETGGVMRAMDFVFKTSTGVNRPLKANEDHPNDNLNKTYYQDQVNKITLAIKEIIASLGQYGQKPEVVQKEIPKPASIPRKSYRSKIVAGSIIVLALIVGFLFAPKLLKPSEQIEKSVAVLPFTNLSNDPEQEYFSDGIVEAILNHLCKVGDLKVISSTSTKRYKNTELSLKEISKDLGVSVILEGSVQKIGKNVRITAQLIDARTDVHLWSETYDKDISDIFSIETEVAQNIANELKVTLTSDEKKQFNKIQTQNTEAYNLYLQGRFFWDKRTKAGIEKSIEYFEKAISLDHNYALAIAGLADAYYVQAFRGWSPAEEGYEKAKKLAERAIEIDSKLAEAHATLGSILCYADWKWEEARKELLLAINLNPNYATAHQYYSELLDILCENDEARKHIDIALSLDPFNRTMLGVSTIYYYNDGNLKRFVEEMEKRQELGFYPNAQWSIFWAYARFGEDLKAIEALKAALLSGDSVEIKNASQVQRVYDSSGMKGIWDWLYEPELKKYSLINLDLTSVYAITGKKEEALNNLEQEFKIYFPGFPRINNDPDFDNVRWEPRFQSLIKKMGLSAYQKRK